MWPQSGGQVSPPIVPSLIQEPQRGQVQAPPSNSSLQPLILEPLHLSQTEIVGSSVIYRCACKYVEEPIAYRKSDYSESVKRKEKVSVSPKRVGIKKVTASYHIRPTFAMPMMPKPSVASQQLANKVIKQALHIYYRNKVLMCCIVCRNLPTLPVTGPCGHTRCTKCVKMKRTCPCGRKLQASLHINVYVQDLMSKILPTENPKPAPSFLEIASEPPVLSGTPSTSRKPRRAQTMCRFRHHGQRSVAENTITFRHPITPEVSYMIARQLMVSGRFKEAATHFAHVAASSGPVASNAKRLLAQTISAMTGTADPRRITRELYRSVRELASFSSLKPSDLECIICYEVLTHPVTTPCGHTFCRACLKRVLYFRNRCPLCSYDLEFFRLELTADTTFISAALASVDSFIPPWSPDSEFIPILACTVAYPTIPCELMILDSRYSEMIQLVLKSGTRKFGVVAVSSRGFSHIGTVVEVLDCVQFEDKRSILSTVGITRFVILESVFKNGCQMARIQNFTDARPISRVNVWDLNMMAQNVYFTAVMWLSTLDKRVLNEITWAFGDFPDLDLDEGWWKNPDGPDWLWWLISILPLKSEIQLLMLSTDLLIKRMMAVSRTLESMRQSLLTPSLCSCVFESEHYLYYQLNTRTQF